MSITLYFQYQDEDVTATGISKKSKKGPSPDAVSDSALHICHLCGMTYASAYLLAQHEESVHRGQAIDKIPCPVSSTKH